MKPASQVHIQITERRFVCVDGVPIGRCTDDGLLEIKDKDRKRSAKRGSEYVVVDVREILAALATRLD